MTTRRDVERLRHANARIVELARRDLQAFWLTLDLSNPEAVRDALLEYVPALVREYGNVAATVAAEWYDEMRPALDARYRATLGAVADAAKVAGSVRYGAGHLFGDDPVGALGVLSGALQRYISYSTRDTVRRNVFRDPAKPRYARVPSGAETCAWCSMLASRGFVYHSESSAGDGARSGFGDDFHDDCDCQVVVEFDRDAHHIEGYDPDRLYEDLYLPAWDAAGGPGATAQQVAAQMRRMFPEQFTDGVHEHDD